jgi:hypothetical protein
MYRIKVKYPLKGEGYLTSVLPGTKSKEIKIRIYSE